MALEGCCLGQVQSPDIRTIFRHRQPHRENPRLARCQVLSVLIQIAHGTSPQSRLVFAAVLNHTHRCQTRRGLDRISAVCRWMGGRWLKRGGEGNFRCARARHTLADVIELARDPFSGGVLSRLSLFVLSPATPPVCPQRCTARNSVDHSSPFSLVSTPLRLPSAG
jgi:hypothetical protein